MFVDNAALHGAYRLGHCERGFAHYLPSVRMELEKIVFVGATNNLTNDAKLLMDMFGTSSDFWVGGIFHEHPAELNHLKQISEEARCNIERLISKDYDTLDILWRAGRLKQRFLRRCAQRDEPLQKPVALWPNTDDPVDKHAAQKTLALRKVDVPRSFVAPSPRSCAEVVSAILVKIPMPNDAIP